ncbi:hypothetical protein [Nocardia transvalensis]|uniref:hypothetical protein n=1 Tax=Nocardia transvalensis TaxID=37333 RepID=UPI001893FAF5|nr:hypothetical protein [Nocardia transvalensis]MBF6327666.1 hypothetical protein [Nocardia transvalensis]
MSMQNSHPQATYQPSPAQQQQPGRAPGRSGPGSLWWEAKTVLVTRVAEPGKLVTAPRLVVPIGERQLAFRVSSQSPEAGQLARDGRVLVQPGDWHGSPAVGSRQRPGFAQLVFEGSLLVHVETMVRTKYRWRVPLARFAHRVARGAAPYGDIVVLVDVHEPSPIPLPPV